MSAPPPQYPPAGPMAPPAAHGPKVSAIWTGLLIALGGLLAAASVFFTYEKLTNLGGSYSFNGLGSETATGSAKEAVDRLEPGSAGKIILVCGVIALVLGLLIATGRGRLWVPIVALVVSAFGLLLGFAALGAPSSDADKLGNVVGSAEFGAVLAAVGTGLALLASLLALVVRRRI